MTRQWALIVTGWLVLAGAKEVPKAFAWQDSSAAASIESVASMPRGCVGQFGESRFRAESQICRVALSPDGTRVIIVGVRGEMGLWNVSTGQLVRKIETGDGSRSSRLRWIPVWSHDGSRIAFTNRQGELRLLDGSSGALLEWQPLLPPEEWGSIKSQLSLAIFSPDDRGVIAGYEGGMIAVIDAATGGLVRSHRCSSTPIASAFRNDATVVVYLSRRTAVEIDWVSGQMSASRRYVPELKTSGRFDFDKSGGLYVADQIYVRMYSPDVRTSQVAFRASYGQVTAVGVSADGQTAVAADVRGYVHVLGTLDLKERVAFSTSMNGIRSVGHVSLSGDGMVTAFASRSGGHRVRLWKCPANGAPAVELHPDHGHAGGVSRLQYSGDGRILLSIGNDTTVHLWDVASQKHVTQVGHGFNGSISGPGDTVALSSPSGGSITIHDTTQPAKPIQLHQLPGGRGVDISGDGSFAACIGVDRPVPIHLYGVSTGTPFRRFQSGASTLQLLRVSPDARRIATVSGDGRVQVWDIRSGRLELNNASGAWPLLEFTPDSKSIVIQASRPGSTSRTPIQIIDVATGNVVQTFDEPPRARTVAIHPKGQRLLSAGSDGRIRAWNLRSGEQLPSVEGLRSPATAVAFSPDGSTFVTGSENGHILLWDTQLFSSH